MQSVDKHVGNLGEDSVIDPDQDLKYAAELPRVGSGDELLRRMTAKDFSAGGQPTSCSCFVAENFDRTSPNYFSGRMSQLLFQMLWTRNDGSL